MIFFVINNNNNDRHSAYMSMYSHSTRTVVVVTNYASI